MRFTVEFEVPRTRGGDGNTYRCEVTDTVRIEMAGSRETVEARALEIATTGRDPERAGVVFPRHPIAYAVVPN